MRGKKPYLETVSARRSIGEGARMADTRIFAFLRWLGKLISWGMPLPLAIEVASQDLGNSRLGKAIRRVKRALERGTPFSLALSRETSVFPPFHAAAIAEAEKRGNLASALRSLWRDTEKSAAASALIRGASLYPIVATVAGLLGILVGAFLITPLALLPARGLLEVLEGFDTTLTTPELLLSWWVKFVGEHGVGILLFLCGGFTLVLLGPSLVRSQRQGSFLFGRRKPRLPLYEPGSNLTIFCETLGTYFKYGLSLSEGLAAAQRAVSSKTFRENISRLARDSEPGSALWESMEKSRLFPRTLVRAVAAGESRGQPGNALLEMADFYREGAENSAQKSARWMEGVLAFLVVLFGLLTVGAVVSTVFMFLLHFWR